MDDIVVMATRAQVLINTPAEGEWFRKSPGAHGDILHLIQRRKEIPNILDFKEVVRIVEIKTGESVKFYTVRQNRIRGSGYDVHLMTEIPQGPAEVVYIDTLTAAGRIPPIGQ
jgi:hypothetical protein